MKPILAGLAFAVSLSPIASSKEVEIYSGDLPRGRSVVTIGETGGIPAEPALQSASGEILPLQKSPHGGYSFVLPAMERGIKASFKLVSQAHPGDPPALAKVEGDQIRFSVTGKSVATYQAAARPLPRPDIDPLYLRGGYLHPVFTPSGKVVTDDYAVGHLHHHGIWMSWTKTAFDGREPDFWNMGQGRGRVDFVSLEKSWSGPVHAGMVSRHNYTDLTSGSPVVVLHEEWTVRVYAVQDSKTPYHIIDLEAVQNNRTDKPLTLPIYHYGGLGVRGLYAWNGEENANFVTSEKLGDRLEANSRPARWIRIGGKVDGGTAGIAVLCHPENFRSPQPVRVHPKEPFICFTPQVAGPMEIKPGESYRARYRFIIMDGEADAKLLEELWQDYAKPVATKWID